jgi:hypothetical protein
VSGLRRVVTRRTADVALDLLSRVDGTDRRLDERAARGAPRTVLVLSIYRPESQLILSTARELVASRHRVRLAFGSTTAAHPELAAETLVEHVEGGKFPNLNRVLEGLGPDGLAQADWVLVVDDDVRLPHSFLDRFLALCEAFELDLAQPAQTLRSHAAWRVTRRRPRSLLRRTRFVEIGPVTAFSRRAADALMPFPELRYGWGLELHWSARAERAGWRLGIADAVPVRHEVQPVASTYGHAEAIAEAQAFLADRPFVPGPEAARTLEAHHRLPE